MQLAREGVRVLVSRGDVGDETVIKSVDGNYEEHGWVTSLSDYTLSLLVSVGGQTSMAEFVDLGIPMILTPPKSHTEHWGIAKSLEKKGIALCLPLAGLRPEQLKEVVLQVLADDERRQRAKQFAAAASQYPGDPVLIAELKKCLSRQR